MHALCACQVTTPDSREHFVTVPSTSPNTNLGASGQGASVFLRRFPKAYTPASFLQLDRAELIEWLRHRKQQPETANDDEAQQPAQVEAAAAPEPAQAGTAAQRVCVAAYYQDGSTAEAGSEAMPGAEAGGAHPEPRVSSYYMAAPPASTAAGEGEGEAQGEAGAGGEEGAVMDSDAPAINLVTLPAEGGETTRRAVFAVRPRHGIQPRAPWFRARSVALR